MTLLTDIVIPFGAVGGLAVLVWGAATMVRGHKSVDNVNRIKIDGHKTACDEERRANRTAIEANKVAISEIGSDVKVLLDRDTRK